MTEPTTSAHTERTNAPSGVSLRDWFAGQALVGLLAYGRQMEYEAAEKAYRIADQMIEARGESEGPAVAANGPRMG